MGTKEKGEEFDDVQAVPVLTHSQPNHGGVTDLEVIDNEKDVSAHSKDKGVNDGEVPFDIERDGDGVDQVEAIHDYTNDVKEFSPWEALHQDVSGDQSPFPEVAACVPNTDDPNETVNTFRMWFLLTFFIIVFTGVNGFFYSRYPSISLGAVVGQLILFPIGKAWAAYVPKWRIGTERFGFDLNPGPFNKKEHAIITISLGLNTWLGGTLFMTYWSPYFLNTDWGPGWAWILGVTEVGLGFGLAGMARQWIVYPGHMIWPQTLSTSVLFSALHDDHAYVGIVSGWSMSRYKFFLVFTLFAFVTFWFPNYIATCTSLFAFITWIWPHNQVVNTLFGMNTGLGLLPISIDWTQYNYVSTPLTTPFYIMVNNTASIVIFFMFLAPILYYKDVWFSGHLPILSMNLFDNTGASYNISRVFDSSTLSFNETGYKEYSPMYISMSYSLGFALAFAAVGSLFVYSVLYNGKEIWEGLRNPGGRGEDVHKRFQNAYENVPHWWYLVLDVIFLALAIYMVRGYPTGMPVWGLFLCYGVSALLVIPQGLLEAISNTRVYLNIVAEVLAGYLWPGKPIANALASTYGNNILYSAMAFAADLKLGQYMHIPPRTLFFGQLYGLLVGTTVQIGVLRWMMGHYSDLCSPDNASHFTCASNRVAYNSLIIWGVIGPERMFNAGQTYNSLFYWFLIGAGVTVISWFAYRRWPNSWLKYFNVPLFFNSAGYIPPATTSNYTLGFLLGFLFNWVIRRRHFGWWKRYTYLLNAAMNAGVTICGIVVFFALTYSGIYINWALNTVGQNTDDYNGVPAFTVPEGGHFGRGVGEF
ncbi:Glutathione transporter 1 [Vanrija pseudolonga]|uniref:Glutathione transporter 1 n=1 Tax=Vanrija pseudolonga TaxID=143232 RepID=A0AAF0Y612_9TREE|nr:Glutathione transporter 1 [Vanrija pseudolonga]